MLSSSIPPGGVELDDLVATGGCIAVEIGKVCPSPSAGAQKEIGHSPARRPSPGPYLLPQSGPGSHHQLAVVKLGEFAEATAHSSLYFAALVCLSPSNCCSLGVSTTV